MIIKHGGGNVMVWGCMFWTGVGSIYSIGGIMDQYQYIHVLENVLIFYADENLPITCKLVHDNDPKQTVKSVKDTIIANSISVISWPACNRSQSN
ncbi:hypothetical protein Trydic_g10115 [Trypoxylus dichotomus]